MFLIRTNWKHNFTIVSLTFPEVFRHLFELQQESQQQLFLMPRASSTPGVSFLLLSKYSQAQWGHTEVALSPLSFAVLMNTDVCRQSSDLQWEWGGESAEKRKYKQGEMRWHTDRRSCRWQSWRCWEFGWRWAGWTGVERRRSEGPLRSSRAAVRRCAGCSRNWLSVCQVHTVQKQTQFTTLSQVCWSIRAAGRKRRAPERFHKQGDSLLVWLDL